MSEKPEDSMCTMGVGDGSGRLFVHGDYESIKAAQAIVLERDAALARVRELESAVPTHGPDARTTAIDARMSPEETLRTLTLVRTMLGHYMADCGKHLDRIAALEAQLADDERCAVLETSCPNCAKMLERMHGLERMLATAQMEKRQLQDTEANARPA